jgi:hypothetical protein
MERPVGAGARRILCDQSAQLHVRAPWMFALQQCYVSRPGSFYAAKEISPLRGHRQECLCHKDLRSQAGAPAINNSLLTSTQPGAAVPHDFSKGASEK